MKIENIINSGFEYIGIRWTTDDEKYTIGDTCRNSYDWDYDNDISSFFTENQVELNGTCAINTGIEIDYDSVDEIKEKIESIINNYSYCGDIVIIGGNSKEYGADDNEIIIKNAVVIDIF